MQSQIVRARELLGQQRVRENVCLAPHTTFRIGGPADLFYEARSADELALAVSLAREQGLPYFVLGSGANILMGDRGFRGLVIKNGAAAVAFLQDGLVTAESGAIMESLIEQALARELSGIEHFAGIPSTVGGALWQNLHFMSPDRTRTVYIAECLVGATILDESNAVRSVPASYFEFGYDDSVLHHRRDIVLAATFRLRPLERAAIRSVIDANLSWRREKHPSLATFASAGSIFKKIEGAGAGRLIDQCGLKGLIVGGAQISPRHANFIVNLGGARAKDVLTLVARCKEAVHARFALDLEMEVDRVGEF